MLKFDGTAIVLVAALLAASAAQAQTNPTADDLIRSLTPTAQSMKNSGTRGLHRLAPGDNAATETPAAVSAAPTQHMAMKALPAAEPAAPAASLYVQFASGSADVTPQAAAALDELGKALSSNALSGFHFRIEGHTDTVGSPATNQQLSERRAASVVTYLKQKFGIEENRMTAVGYGSDHLLVPTGNQTSEARNRRVQVVNLGA